LPAGNVQHLYRGCGFRMLQVHDVVAPGRPFIDTYRLENKARGIAANGYAPDFLWLPEIVNGAVSCGARHQHGASQDALCSATRERLSPELPTTPAHVRLVIDPAPVRG